MKKKRDTNNNKNIYIYIFINKGDKRLVYMFQFFLFFTLNYTRSSINRRTTHTILNKPLRGGKKKLTTLK